MLLTGDLANGRYRILRPLGRGGMGLVYLVYDERLGRLWAMKTYPESGALTEAGRSLEKELALLGGLHHPYLPEPADIFMDGASLCLVMTYVEGKNLRQLVRDRMTRAKRPAEPEQILAWARELCGVLAYLHKQEPPIIYGDLKPSNIMVRADGHICLIDFGSALSARAGEGPLSGTPGYCAPEQAAGRPGDVRSDIYAFGAVLQFLMTGADPGTDAAPAPSDPGIETADSRALLEGLAVIASVCMAPAAGDRYASMAALAKALDRPEALGRTYLLKRRRERWLRQGFFILGLVCLLAGLACDLVCGRLRSYGYEEDLARAMTESPSRASFWLADAICLKPDRSDAYCQLIRQMAGDGLITEGEWAAFTELLYGKASEEALDHLSLLRQNRAACYELAYAAGTGLFYYAEEGLDTGRMRSLWWLDLAKETGPSGTDLSEEEALKEKHIRVLTQICRCSAPVLSGPAAGAEDPESLCLALEDLLALAETSQDLAASVPGLLLQSALLLYDHLPDLTGQRGVDRGRIRQLADRIDALTEGSLGLAGVKADEGEILGLTDQVRKTLEAADD